MRSRTPSHPPLRRTLAAAFLAGPALLAAPGGNNLSVAGGSSGDFRLLDSSGIAVALGSVPNGAKVHVRAAFDGNVVAATASTGAIRLWNASGAAVLLTTFPGHDDSVPLSVATRGGLTVVGASSGSWRIYGASGALVATGAVPNVRSVPLSVATDGTLVVVAGSTGSVRLLNASGAPLTGPINLAGHDPGAPVAVAAGTTALAGTTNGAWRVYGSTGALLCQGTLPAPAGNVVPLSVAVEGGFGVVGSPSGDFRLLNVCTVVGGTPTRIPGHDPTVALSVATSAGGTGTTVVGASGGAFRVLANVTGAAIANGTLSNDPLTPVALASAGGFSMLASTSGQARILGPTGAQTLAATFANDPEVPPAVAIDGTFGALVASDGTPRAWLASNGTPQTGLPSLAGAGLLPCSAALDGGALAYAGAAGNFRLYGVNPVTPLVLGTTFAGSPPDRPLPVATDRNATALCGILGDARIFQGGATTASFTVPTDGNLPLVVETDGGASVFASTRGRFEIRGLAAAPVTGRLPNRPFVPLAADADDGIVVVGGALGDFRVFGAGGASLASGIVANSVHPLALDTDDGITVIAGDSGDFAVLGPTGATIASGSLGNAGKVFPLAADTDDGWTIVASPSGEVRVFGPTGALAASTTISGSSSSPPVVDTDGGLSVAARQSAIGTPVVALFDGASPVALPTLTMSGLESVPLSADVDHERLVVGNTFGGYALLDRAGTLLATGTAPNDLTRRLPLDTDGGLTAILGSTALGATLHLRGFDGSLLSQTALAPAPLAPWAVDVDGGFVFAGSPDGTMGLWDGANPVAVSAGAPGNATTLPLSIDTDPAVALQVLGIVPGSGPPSGGTLVTIAGTGFEPPPSASATIAGVPLSGLLSVGETMLRGTTGAAAAFGPADVTVTTSQGSATLAGGFVLAHDPIPYGTSCSGTGVAAPTIGTAGGLPYLGNPQFALTAAPTPANAATLFVLGVSNTSFFGIPLPLDLGPFGAPNCFLLASTDVFLFVNAAGSTATLPLPIPLLAVLLGNSIFAQALVVAPGANALGGVMTGGLEIPF